MRLNFGLNGLVNPPPTKLAIARMWLTFAFIVGPALLWATPAEADGEIFAEIYLTNNTTQAINIPFSGAQTGQLWGTQFNTLDLAGYYVVMPDGSPPRILGPGQTMLWGTKSNGGFLATTGTGGSLTIPVANATINWSVPWGFFNGLFDSCDGEVRVTGGNTFGSNITVTGGGGGAGNNTCIFDFALNQQ